MSEPVFDSLTDPQIAAVSRLLTESLRAEFGAGIVEATHRWPAPVVTIPATRYPALVTYWSAPQQEAGAAPDEDEERLVMRLDYYAPPVPLDRAELRWPVLRNVWKHCLGRLRMGRDPAVDGGAPLLSNVGIVAPSLITGQARFQLAPIDGAWIPSFEGTVTLRVSSDFPTPGYDVDELNTIYTEATLGDEGDDVDPADIGIAFESLDTD